jgi:Sulfate permease family
VRRRHVRAPPARLRSRYQYPLSWLRGDLLAGVTVAAYLVPQVMAYAQVAGLRPAAGLWAAVPALVIYAVLGSSRSLSLGPEATTALMTAAAVGPLAAGHPARYAALASSAGEQRESAFAQAAQRALEGVAGAGADIEFPPVCGLRDGDVDADARTAVAVFYQHRETRSSSEPEVAPRTVRVRQNGRARG